MSDIGRFLRDFGVLTLTSALKTGQCPPTVDCRCAMGQDFKTLEVADDGCGRLQFVFHWTSSKVLSALDPGGRP